MNVPVFSGNADAGRITSARYAVSVRKMSCTTSISSAASAWRACATSGSDIAGFSPMMYMPRIVPACTASMISTTVSPGLRVERAPPQRLEAARAPRRCRRAGSPAASSGSGRHRSRPERCSGRATDAGPCPAAPPAPSSARARSGNARCRCRARAARCPCPRGSSIRRTSRTAAPPRGSSARRNPADRRHRLGAVAGDILPQFVEAARAIRDEARRGEPLLDDRVHHRVEQRDVGVRLDLQEMRGMPRELRAARLGEDRASCRA